MGEIHIVTAATETQDRIAATSSAVKHHKKKKLNAISSARTVCVSLCVQAGRGMCASACWPAAYRCCYWHPALRWLSTWCCSRPWCCGWSCCSALSCSLSTFWSWYWACWRSQPSPGQLSTWGGGGGARLMKLILMGLWLALQVQGLLKTTMIQKKKRKSDVALGNVFIFSCK